MICESTIILKNNRVADSFSQAACRYDNNAMFQQETGFILLSLLKKSLPTCNRVVDLGCGTGFFIPHLQTHYAHARVTGIDIACGMLNKARARNRDSSLHFIRADCHELPLASGSTQAIYANLVFQWCYDLKQALQECKRVLAPEGEMVFSILLKPSLRELRYSWESLTGHNNLMGFPAEQTVKEYLYAAGFKINTVLQKTFVLRYASVYELLAVMKSQGTNRGTFCGDNGLFTGSKLAKLEEHYRRFCEDENVFPATYEVMFLHVS